MLISKSIHEEVSVILLPKHPVLVCYAAILYHTGKKKILPKCIQLIFYCLEFLFEKANKYLAVKIEKCAMHGKRNST